MAATKTIHEAFFAAYTAITDPVKNATNPHFKNAYANLDTLLDNIKPVLTANGLMLIQENVSDENGVGVRTFVTNAAGEVIDFGAYTLPLAKRDPQGGGSCITYARRYALKSIFGLSERDDDGEGASEHAAADALRDEFQHKVFEPSKSKGTGDKVLSELKASDWKAALAIYKAKSPEQRAIVAQIAAGAEVKS